MWNILTICQRAPEIRGVKIACRSVLAKHWCQTEAEHDPLRYKATFPHFDWIRHWCDVLSFTVNGKKNNDVISEIRTTALISAWWLDKDRKQLSDEQQGYHSCVCWQHKRLKTSNKHGWYFKRRTLLHFLQCTDDLGCTKHSERPQKRMMLSK